MKKTLLIVAALFATVFAVSAKEIVIKADFASNGNTIFYTTKGDAKQYLPVKGKHTSGEETYFVDDTKGKSYEVALCADGTYERDGKTNKCTYMFYKNKSAFQLVGQGSYLKTPAIKGMRLVKIVVKNANAGSKARKVEVFSDKEFKTLVATIKSPSVDDTVDSGEVSVNLPAGSSAYIVPKIGYSNICISYLELVYTNKK